MRIRAKICGITRLEDALAAAASGADAIGFVFHESSPRYIDVDKALSISRQLPPFVTTVGLFVNAGATRVEQVLARLPLGLLQFHGDESPEDCGRYGRPYIKAIAMRDGVDPVAEAARYGQATGLLFDSHVTGVEGGSGQTFDWSRIPGDIGKPLILAGGLTPDNVGQAIAQVRPYAVDVSSGVEARKGIKDAVRMAAFMNEVNKFS